MNEELIIAAYGSHNAAVAMYYNGKYTVIEVERWINKKNAGLVNYLPSAYPQIIFDEIAEFLLAQTNRSDVDLYLTNYCDLNKIKPKFKYTQHRSFDHHTAHAATAFYQSPYEDALTFTYDGGGDLGFFNVYRTSRTNGITLLERFNQDLGFAYMILADHLDDITRDPLNIGNLVYAGKLMGLCSYGTVRSEWLDAFTEFYEAYSYSGSSFLGGAEVSVEALPRLMNKIGIDDYNKSTRIKDQTAWDIAATTQFMFEQQFFKYAQPYIDQYPDLPVTMSGGCALNVILNAKLLEQKNGRVFVPPNTSDCGVAVGGILMVTKPETQIDLTYSGTPILDEHMFSSYIENGAYSIIENVGTKELANYINLGNIVGIIDGNSEHGPRALGNRSIICNPVGDMKDVLNAKVKNREWYRPFAPIVRLEDAATYFHFPKNAQSRHMTYVAEVRDEYKEVIPAVTHEDGTGRIQTVTHQQNPLMYELLTEFSAISDHSVLLNTSFNVNGKPILTRLSDALDILRTSELDAVYYKRRLIFRKGSEESYQRNIISENIKPLDEDTTLYLLAIPEGVGDMTSNHIPKMQQIIEARGNNIVIITPTEHMHLLRETFGESIQYYEIANNMLYYHEMIQDKIPEVEMTHHAFTRYSRLLWIKPVMHKNFYRTKYHMFVTIADVVDNEEIESTINIIINLASDEDRVIVRTSTYTGNFSEDEVNSYINSEVTVSKAPMFDIVWGSIDQIEWLSRNYESHLLSFMRQGAPGNDIDYGLLLFMQHPDKFKVV